LKLLFLDNYDSFTYNLVHYFKELGAEVTVVTQDDTSVLDLDYSYFDAVVIGPGPNSPNESGILMSFLESCQQQVKPVLGVCLGHQAIGVLLGMQLARAQKPMHGKTSFLHHVRSDIFESLPSPMCVGRYHSLVIHETAEQSAIEVLMRDELGQIMAFRSKEFPLWGIQFHPESVLTPEGKWLLNHWLEQVKNLH
jgi:anthranilate synthase component II